MPEFVRLEEEERREVIQQGAVLSGTPGDVLEKDAWLVWALRELFAVPGEVLRIDFQRMVEQRMFLAAVPDFDVIMSRISDLEAAINEAVRETKCADD